MAQKKRMKLCKYCDGQMDLDVIVCPFCGNETAEEEIDQALLEKERPYKETLSPKETMNSLYPPPYQPKVFSSIDVEEEEEEKSDVKKEFGEKKKSDLFPALFLSLGLNLFIFSLFLIIFSQNGKVNLKWDSRFWLVYFLLSLPLLYLGIRSIRAEENN